MPIHLDKLDIDELTIDELTIDCLRIKKLIIDEIVFPPRRIVTEDGDKITQDDSDQTEIISDESPNPL